MKSNFFILLNILFMSYLRSIAKPKVVKIYIFFWEFYGCSSYI